MQEKYLPLKGNGSENSKNKTLYFAFVDLETAFDRVPRKILWLAMRSRGISEWVVPLVQGMYNNTRIKYCLGDSYRD